MNGQQSARHSEGILASHPSNLQFIDSPVVVFSWMRRIVHRLTIWYSDSESAQSYALQAQHDRSNCALHVASTLTLLDLVRCEVRKVQSIKYALWKQANKAYSTFRSRPSSP
jgi:hypothetical protein